MRDEELRVLPIVSSSKCRLEMRTNGEEHSRDKWKGNDNMGTKTNLVKATNLEA